MFEQTIIVGHLGSDPELRYTSAGTPVATFSVAVNRKWTNQDGTAGEETKWFRVSAWRKLAETCAQYLAKGRQVMVVGRVTASAFTGKDGAPRSSLELTADNVRFLGGNGNGSSQDDNSNVGMVMANAAMMSASPQDEEIPF